MIFFDDNIERRWYYLRHPEFAEGKKNEYKLKQQQGMNKKKLIKADFFTTGRADKNKNTSDFYMATGLHFLLKPHNRQTGY